MKRRVSLNTSRALLALVFVALPGCFDGPLEAHQGGPGYACSVHEECTSPLLCLEVPPTPAPVCTGEVLEGQACDDNAPCVWLRDARGLPLGCVDGVCQFPADGSETP